MEERKELEDRLVYYKAILEKNGEDYQSTIKEIMKDKDIEEDEILLFGDIFDIYNTEFMVDTNMEVNGARIMVACGGPNIYINTQDNLLEICWGGKKAELYFIDEWNLEQEVEEMWEATKMRAEIERKGARW